MLKGLLKHRIKEFTAVYVEPKRVELVRGFRPWRTWQMDPAEQHTASEGESVFELLQRLHLKPRGGKGNALIVVLPRIYYSCHREHYPAALGEQINEAVSFDWQENVFYEPESTLHFSASPVFLEKQFSVGIFSIQTAVYNKFFQALNGNAFENYAVIPSALAHKASLAHLPREREHEEGVQILARAVDDSHLEVCRFLNGELLDSMILGRSPYDTMIFAERMKSMQQDESTVPGASIHLMVSNEEEPSKAAQELIQTDLSFQLQRLESSFIAQWMRHFIEQDSVRSFERELMFKPWEVPRVVWPMVTAILLFTLYAAHQSYSHDALQNEVRAQRQEVLALERQWRPIEELQTRITKFEEDKKTLAEFSDRNIPLLDLMNLLSIVTPEDTWVNYLSIRDNRLMLRGESKSAIRYLSELSRLEGFSDVRFASPVTRNPASDLERFNLQLQLEASRLMETFAAMRQDKTDAMTGEDAFQDLTMPLKDEERESPELPENIETATIY